MPAGVWPEVDVIRGLNAIWTFYAGVLDGFEARGFADGVEFVDAGVEDVLVQHRVAEPQVASMT